METGARYDELDGYRGLAALMIVAYHATGTVGLHAPIADLLSSGVGWFFVLSGFVIGLPFARAALGQAPIPARPEFARRRAWRLLPPYYVALLVAWWLAYAGRGGWADLIEHLTFAHIFDPRYIVSPATIGPAWTLADEVAFYAIVAVAGPPLCRRCLRLPVERRARALVAAIFPALGAAVAYRALLVLAGGGRSLGPVAFCWPLPQFGGFALGLLAAVAVAARWHLPRAFAVARPAAILACLLALVVCPTAPLVTILPDLGAVGFLLLIAPGLLDRRRAPRLLASRPFVALGAMSYSLYIWHAPVIRWLHARAIGQGAHALPVLIGCCMVAGALAYALVECPAIRRARRPSPPRSAHPSALPGGMATSGPPLPAAAATPCAATRVSVSRSASGASRP